MLKFELRLKIRNCPEIFLPGWPPGVVVVQTVEFADADQTALNDPMFTKALLEAEDEFLTHYVEVEHIQVAPEDPFPSWSDSLGNS